MITKWNQKGFTFVEVMMAVGIGMILLAGASATYIAQSRSYVAQESVSEVNSQSKVSLDLIADKVRSAGFGAPSEMDLDPVAGYTSIITPTDMVEYYDSITIISGFRKIGTVWPAGGGPGMACPDNVTLGSNEITIDYDGDLAPNMMDKRYLSIDGVNFVEVLSCTLDGFNCDDGIITLDRSLAQNFPLTDDDDDGLCDSGRPVYLLEDVTFCVDYESNLRRIRRGVLPGACMGSWYSDEDIIAENIEDLQFAYAVDANEDGSTDDQNGDDIIDGNDFIDGMSVTDNSTITAVRINVLAKADREDANFKAQGTPPSQIENRYHYTTSDNYRRRLWHTIVHLRNN